jgi:DNA-binding beta-propeller fold protein YncE
MDLRPMARGALAAVLVAVALLTAGCAAPRTTNVVQFVSPKAAVPAGVFSLLPGDDPALTQTGSGTYLSWHLPAAAPASAGGAGLPCMELARIDPRTAAIEATNTFSAGLLGAPLFAAGSLWVTDSASLGELLLRLDPVTLMVTGELSLSAARYPQGSHLAYAGGWLWADGGGRLLRVSPPGVNLTASIALRGADRSNVAASPDGSVLIVTEQGPAGAIERRDPRTGALLAADPIAGAVVVDGFTGSSVWVTAVTGTSARAERLSLRSMRPVMTHPVSGPAGLRVQVAHGKLWVADGLAGGRDRDYCADTGTGRPIAALPVEGPGHGGLLGVGDGVLYYAEPAPHGTGTRIAPVPVPGGCG